jgi:hypothetical protein
MRDLIDADFWRGMSQRLYRQSGLKLYILLHVTFAGLATLSLSGCNLTIPPIAQGGPRDVQLVTPYFDDRVKQRFPVGSDEEELRRELRREGFRISATNNPQLDYQHIASYQENGACKVSWTVRWNAEQGKITNTTAIYTQTCL